jgi:exopolysaccharide biosynthesis polyprenyl glycosylphosphotransferase
MYRGHTMAMNLRASKYQIVILAGDGIVFSLAWLGFYLLRVKSGFFESESIPDLFLPMLVVNAYWYVLFWIAGLYRPWWAKSRMDELIALIKAITIGVLILFFLIFIDDAMSQDPSGPRMRIAMYWLILIFAVGLERMTARSIRRRMLIAGIGQHNTLIIGPPAKSAELAETLRAFPALGFRIIGHLSSDTQTPPEQDLGTRLGDLDDLESVIPAQRIEEIIITLDSKDHERLLDIIGRCSAFNVGIKIRPDLYDILSGLARTNQLYGVPLIEVTPQLMAPWEQFMKRLIDLTVGVLVLVLGAPLFLIIALAEKLTSRGPVFYNQQRVGKNGALFTIHKFRTMYTDAESRGGPQWAQKDDPRVTPLGRFLRRSHLDELPQVINVLNGDMSIVGPRPERPFFVDQFVKEIPLYRRRLNVRPGITGWAQVKHTYDQTIEDVRMKLSYDLFYIENMSIRMDMKIILSTAYNMLTGKGHT